MKAVEKVYAGYRESIDRQHKTIAATLSIAVLDPKPQSQLHLTDAGLEMVIRFPVPLESAAAIDDQMTRGLLAEVAVEPALKLVGFSAPG